MRPLLRRLGDVAQAYGGVIRSRAYFPLWLGQLVSTFGDALHYIALVVLVFRLTGHGVAVAGLVAAEIVPVLLLGPVAGVIIDRFSRKAVLITAELARALLALSLVWPQGVWQAYLVAAGLAAGGTFFNPTVRAVIPGLTTEEQRLAANSVAWSTAQLVQIVAAGLAGGLIAFFGTGPAFAVNAASFLVSAAGIATLPIPAHAGHLGADTKAGFGGHLADARAGLAFSLQDRFVSRLLVVQALASLAVGATGALLIVLAQRFLGLPPAGFALLIGAIGAGVLLGPLIPNTVATDYRDARWLFVPYVIRGMGDVLMATVRALPVALLLQFVYGLNTSTGMVVFSSTVQGAVPDRVRGRVFTLLDVTWSLFQLLSLAVEGLLVDRVGIRAIYWGGGTLLVLAGLLGLVLLRHDDVREARTSEGLW
jgi:MFS family permease